MSKMQAFNPNDQSRGKVYTYATYVPHRSPEFKMHTKLAHAKAAVSCHRCNVILYKLVDGEWLECGRIESGDRRCSECGHIHWNRAWEGDSLVVRPQSYYNCNNRQSFKFNLNPEVANV